MFFDPISLIIMGVLAASVAVAYWDNVREAVATWLRNKGLQKTALMDAWITLDLVVGRVRSRVFTKTRQHDTAQISEETVPLDQLDEGMRAQLRQSGYAEKNIMSLLA
jgi:hypothetical protein